MGVVICEDYKVVVIFLYGLKGILGNFCLIIFYYIIREIEVQVLKLEVNIEDVNCFCDVLDKIELMFSELLLYVENVINESIDNVLLLSYLEVMFDSVE